MESQAASKIENPFNEVPAGRYLTKKDVAEILNCSPKTVQRMVRDGELRVTIIRRRTIRFDPRSLREDMERLETRAY